MRELENELAGGGGTLRSSLRAAGTSISHRARGLSTRIDNASVRFTDIRHSQEERRSSRRRKASHDGDDSSGDGDEKGTTPRGATWRAAASARLAA